MLDFGGGVIAIWHDIADHGLEDFYEWHNREHVPERVSIEGFLRGRRYIATLGKPTFFTLYNVRDPAVLASKAYHDRLNSPTPWTLRAVDYFSAEARSLCAVLKSRSIGAGGVIGTIWFDADPAEDPKIESFFSDTLLAGILATPTIVGIHICRADLDTSRKRSIEQKDRADNLVPRWVILVEGGTTPAVEAVLAGPLGRVAAGAIPASASRAAYQLQHDLAK